MRKPKNMYVSPKSKFVLSTERRWNRIVDLTSFEGAHPSPPQDDMYVVQGFLFIKEVNAANGDNVKMAQISRRYPDLYEAYTLKNVGDPVTRSVVESYLVAGMTPGMVAQQFGSTASIVEWYQKIWFDTGKEPLTRAQITSVLIPEVHSADFSAHDHNAFFKLLAGCSDPATLCDVVECKVRTPEEFKRIHSVVRSFLQQASLKAAASLPVNKFTAATVVQIYQEWEKAEKELELAAGSQGGILADAMVNILKAAGMSWQQMRDGLVPPEMHDATAKVHMSGSLLPAGKTEDS